jgi:hypothetical protein
VSGNRLRFSRKPQAHLWIEGNSCRQDFDGHRAIEAGIRCTEDLTHASGAEAALYAIGAKRRHATNVRTLRKQGRGCGSHRPIQDDECCILAEQRLDLLPQGRVAGARVREKRVARGRIVISSKLVDSCDLMPTLGIKFTCDPLRSKNHNAPDRLARLRSA